MMPAEKDLYKKMSADRQKQEVWPCVSWVSRVDSDFKDVSSQRKNSHAQTRITILGLCRYYVNTSMQYRYFSLVYRYQSNQQATDVTFISIEMSNRSALKQKWLKEQDNI